MKVDAIGKKKKTEEAFVIYPDAGLGNRLNCIYSGLYWQKCLNKKMKILWEVETCCCINFEKLFLPLPDVEVKTVYTLSIREKKAIRSLIGKLIINRLKKSPAYLTSETTAKLFSDGGEEAVERMLLEPSVHYIKAFSVFAKWDHIAEMVNELKPSQIIQERVETIMNPYKGRPVIGIHIRRTDNVLAIQNSPISVFIDRMKKIVNEFPTTYFYLATDDEEVEQWIFEEFSCIQHKTFSDRKSRNTEAGMMDAYVDMLCLSMCEKIYGSYGSTFSKMAAVIGKKEYVVLQER